MTTRKQVLTQIKKMGCTVDEENQNDDFLVIDAPKGKVFACTGTHCLVEPLVDEFNPNLKRSDAYKEIIGDLTFSNIQSVNGLMDCEDPECDICHPVGNNMTDKIIKSGYGLLHKKTNKIVGFKIRSNDGGDFCNIERCELSLDEDNIWIVKDKITASYARVNSTPWYNADYESPAMDIGEPEEFEVVKIEITATPEIPDHIPTFEEYMNLKYNTPGMKYYDPKHYEFHIEQYRMGASCAPVSLYEIEELMKEISNTRPRKL